MDAEEFSLVVGQAMSLHYVAIWKNVNARYPGFTEDISTFVWDLVDVKHLKFSDRKIVDFLLVEFPKGVDALDRVEGEIDVSSKVSKKFDAVSSWLSAVFKYQSVVESVIHGNHLIPLENMSAYQHYLCEIESLKKDNEFLLSKIDGLGDSHKEISGLPHKRVMSIYKLIVGIAEEKFGYNGISSHNAVSKIHSALHGDRELGKNTIRDILVDASRFISK